MLQGIDHINIVVDDLEKMTAFYTERLGFEVTRRATISGDWIEKVVGLADPVAHVVYLETAVPPRIELLKYETPAAPRPEGLGLSNTPGMRHIAFRVDHLDDVLAKLQEAGVEFFSPPQRVPDTQVRYKSGVRKRLVYFQDPEGNLLELCEYREANE